MGWHYPHRTFVRRRVENPEQNDEGSVPITLQECYRAQDALTRCDRLEDLGIYPVSKWSLKARCYMHGWQSRDVETTELVPRVPRIECHSCDRALPITARIKEKEWGAM